MDNQYLDQALMLFQQGFDTVNSIQGLIIALIAAFLMKFYRQIIIWSLVATLAHEVANVVQRVMANDPSPLPNFADLDGDLKMIGIRFLGFLIAISILYMLRRLFLKR